MQVVLDDYGWAAGVATELVNSAPGVWSGSDRLPDAAAVRSFLDEHAPVAACADVDVRAVHALRTRLRALIDDPRPEPLVDGGGALTGAVGAMTLVDGGDGRRRWALEADPDGGVAERLALICGVGILGVVHTLGPGRFRPCAAPTCSGVFIDTSRPGRRRYCMPAICGNRVNVANHRARRAGRT